MTKIVITNYGSRMNKGDVALLNSRIKTLKEFIPDAGFAVFTYHPEVDNKPEMKYLQDINIKFYDVPGRVGLSPRGILKTVTSIFKIFLYRIGLNTKLNETSGIQEYFDADIIISTGGDVLTEDYGSPFSHFINLLFGILLNKPVVLYAESIGPFNKKWNKIITKFLFNRMSLITLREEISRKHLKELGIDKAPIYVTADSAFLLKPAPHQTIEEIMLKEGIDKSNKRLIGVSVSKIIARYGFLGLKDNEGKYTKYINLMSKVVDYLIENLNATIIFVPHVIEPWGNDDRTVADDVINLVKNKDNCISIKREYTAEEIKGIIGKCDLFIGARMHATIASASMLVPTIAIAYSHKTHGIIGKMLGQEKYAVDIKNLDYAALISKIDDVYNNRDKIRKDLESKMDYVKERALLNAKLVRDLVVKEEH